VFAIPQTAASVVAHSGSLPKVVGQLAIGRAIYCTWPLGTLTRSVSEGVKPLPRLHFGLVWDVSSLAARSISISSRVGELFRTGRGSFRWSEKVALFGTVLEGAHLRSPVSVTVYENPLSEQVHSGKRISTRRSGASAYDESVNHFEKMALSGAFWRFLEGPRHRSPISEMLYEKPPKSPVHSPDGRTMESWPLARDDLTGRIGILRFLGAFGVLGCSA
jgi:hypothetical protein